jgi:small subunit ribosomal protein S7
MPRRREVPERTIVPDPKYNNKLVSKFIKSIMRDGKKSTAESILYNAFHVIEERTKESAIKVFEQAIENVKPTIEVKSRRVGGSTYQVPTEIRPSRKTALGMEWLINWQLSYWMPPTKEGLLSKRRKIPIRWLRQTRRLRITAGKLYC